MSESDTKTLNQLRERAMQAENAGDAAFFEESRSAERAKPSSFDASESSARAR